MKNKVVLALSLVMLMPGVCQAFLGSARVVKLAKDIYKHTQETATTKLSADNVTPVTLAATAAALVVGANVANEASRKGINFVNTYNFSSWVSLAAWKQTYNNWAPWAKNAVQTAETAVVSAANTVDAALTQPADSSADAATKAKLAAKAAVKAPVKA